MAVTRISQSSLKQGLKKNKNFVAGIPPVLGRYYALASETVGAGGAASIEFTNIPSTYRHLQIRGIGRSRRSLAATTGVQMRFNSDNSNSYSNHVFYGTGASIAADSYPSLPYISWITTFPDDGNASGMVGGFIIDILDYANTSKTKTVRCMGGVDRNGSGYMALHSALWISTNAITSISLIDSTGNGHAQYTTAALYGIV